MTLGNAAAASIRPLCGAGIAGIRSSLIPLNLRAVTASDTTVLKWRESLICFHCGSRKVDIHLRDRVRPERGPRRLRSFIQLGN
jgi:hypothetical protein